MIDKHKRGKGFRGVTNYLLVGRPEASIIGGNMAGLDPRQLSAEFAISRQLKPKIKSPVFHASLRLPKGEHLTDDQWQQVGASYMKDMGFGVDHQYVIVKHDASAGEHIHMVASSISLSGKVNPLKDSYKMANKATAKIEKKFGLTVAVPPLPPAGSALEKAASLQPLRATRDQIAMEDRTGSKDTGVRLSAVVAKVAKECRGDTKVFIEALKARGIDAMPNIAETGKLSGFSFQANGQTFKGGDINFKMDKLGKAMGLPKSPEGFYLKGDQLAYALQSKANSLTASAKSKELRLNQEREHYPDLKNSITADETGEPKPSKRRRTLEIKFNPTVSPEAPTRQIYRWNPDGSVAFIVDPNKISFRNKSDTAYRAGVQKMKDLGWKSCTLNGDDQFKSKMWIECQLQGVKVSNYQPTAKDEAALKAALEAKATGQWKKPIAISPPEPAKPIPVAKPVKAKPVSFWSKLLGPKPTPAPAKPEPVKPTPVTPAKPKPVIQSKPVVSKPTAVTPVKPEPVKPTPVAPVKPVTPVKPAKPKPTKTVLVDFELTAELNEAGFKAYKATHQANHYDKPEDYRFTYAAKRDMEDALVVCPPNTTDERLARLRDITGRDVERAHPSLTNDFIMQEVEILRATRREAEERFIEELLADEQIQELIKSEEYDEKLEGWQEEHKERDGTIREAVKEVAEGYAAAMAKVMESAAPPEAKEAARDEIKAGAVGDVIEKLKEKRKDKALTI